VKRSKFLHCARIDGAGAGYNLEPPCPNPEQWQLDRDLQRLTTRVVRCNGFLYRKRKMMTCPKKDQNFTPLFGRVATICAAAWMPRNTKIFVFGICYSAPFNPMPRIFDNIAPNLLAALRDTLAISQATISVERQDQETILKGEDFIGFIMHDVIGGKIRLFEKQNRPIIKSKPVTGS